MIEYYHDRGREIVQKAPELFIDVDVEADGVAGFGSLLSVGAVTPWGDTFYRELKPASELAAPGYREFTETHGMERERLMVEGIETSVAIREFTDWAVEQRDKYHKVGGIALSCLGDAYDFPLLNLEIIRAGIESPFGHVGFDIESFAMALPRRMYSWRQTSKGELPTAVLPDRDFTHHALEDALYQQAVHFALVGIIRGPELDEPETTVALKYSE